MKVVFLLTVLVCGVASQCKTPWEDCGKPPIATQLCVLRNQLIVSLHIKTIYSICFAGSTEVTIDSVSIPNCCAAPCQIPRGQSTNFTFSFTPSEHRCMISEHTQMFNHVCLLCRNQHSQHDSERLWGAFNHLHQNARV